tara:strand:- start:1126 stop:1578 length:453 start_codon:yes stop_codon:yes gene_type:complete
MKLNSLIKLNEKKIRPGRGIGSGKGKTSGRGHKGQKSRSGVAIKSFEGGQMPLYRRLPKRGFKSIHKKDIAILNLSSLQAHHDSKKINIEKEITLEGLKKIGLVAKKYNKLKILGTGEIKSKVNLSVNFVSKQAKLKIEKAGGILNIVKK